MNSQEAQQAQTIAEIRAAHHLDMHFVGKLEDTVILQLLCHRKDLLEIVDSQAQKIAEHAKEIERLKKIEKAARDVLYYQGSEGSAELLESALEETP